MSDEKDEKQERRQSKRVKADFHATYDIREPFRMRAQVGNKEVYTRMLDLSEKGIAIATDCNLPEGTILSLRFTLVNPHASEESEKVKEITAIGDVRYNQSCGERDRRLGICFTSIADKDKAALADFVKIQSLYYNR
jgi:c-di-GMP-binding flagellar brake protein YcgR